jgi:hypothetical protein
MMLGVMARWWTARAIEVGVPSRGCGALRARASAPVAMDCSTIGPRRTPIVLSPKWLVVLVHGNCAKRTGSDWKNIRARTLPTDFVRKSFSRSHELRPDRRHFVLCIVIVLVLESCPSSLSYAFSFELRFSQGFGPVGPVGDFSSRQHIQDTVRFHLPEGPWNSCFSAISPSEPVRLAPRFRLQCQVVHKGLNRLPFVFFQIPSIIPRRRAL